MLRSLSLLSLTMLMFSWYALPAHGGVMDLKRTAGGADQPFTTLTDDVSTPWEMYLQPAVTFPTVNRRAWFAEPGLGNHKGFAFGHILADGSLKNGRPFWVIWDQLVGVPAPYLLWQSAGMSFASDDGTAGPEHEFLPEVGWLLPDFQGAGLDDTSLPSRGHEVGQIPEPATLGLWAAALLLLVFYRNRRPAPAMAYVS